jgi:integrase/recombinase XerD
MSDQEQQLPLFDEEHFDEESPAPDPDILQAASSLEATIPHYTKHMQYQGFAENTIKAFVSDLRLLGQYAGMDRPVSGFATKDLQDFLHWMLHERGVPCSPKTYARRVTTLKVFFRWLSDSNVIPRDPADPVIHEPVSSPLPIILYDEEVERLLSTTEVMRQADSPDTRPHLLVSLLVQTGIKKGETMSLTPASFDASDPDAPVLWIRYENPRMRYKERRLRLEPGIMPILNEYLGQYEIKDALFNCTARNLEYILRDVAKAADIDKKVSFEVLRWTSAVRDYRRGMDKERLREKMGLSRISWRETGAKIGRLAERAL